MSPTNYEKTTSSCPSCGRLFSPDATWHGANFCRALLLLDILAEEPGLSAFELGEKCGMTFPDASRGMAKLRDRNVVDFWPEEREQGGIRYRFRSKVDHDYQRGEFLKKVERQEVLAAQYE